MPDSKKPTKKTYKVFNVESELKMGEKGTYSIERCDCSPTWGMFSRQVKSAETPSDAAEESSRGTLLSTQPPPTFRVKMSIITKEMKKYTALEVNVESGW